jgi:hypothetical protein
MRSPCAAALVLVVAAAAAACKNERPPPPPPGSSSSGATPVAPVPAADAAPVADAPRTVSQETRDRSSFRVAERAGAFELSDGAGRLTLVLPSRPQLDGDVVEQENVDAFHARAAASGAVNVEVGLVTTLDAPLPAKTMDEMAQLPADLAGASGGTIARNEATRLAGSDARRYEVAGGKERLFGRTLLVDKSQFLLITCVGPDTPASRTVCEAIAASLTLAR